MIFPKSVTSTLKGIPLVYGMIWIMVFSVHCVYSAKAEGVATFTDSASYYSRSKLSLTDENFYGTDRPPGILLFYKFFSTYNYSGPAWENCIHKSYYAICSDDLLLYSQSLFSLAALTFLGIAGAMTGRTSIGRLALFVVPLVVSLHPLVAEWNFIALSESFSLSMFFAFVAFWIFFLKTKHPFWLGGICVAALCWGGMRDSNSYVLVMIAVVIALIMLVRIPLTRLGFASRLPRFLSVSFGALCIFFVTIFALMDASREQAPRWRWVAPFYNVMGTRILPVPEHVAYFSEHGMPVSPALYERTGKSTNAGDDAFFNDPRLEEFRLWTKRSGKTTYMRFLLSHPLYAVTAPALSFPDIFLKDMSWFLSGHMIPGHLFPRLSIHFNDRFAVATAYLLLVGYGVTIGLIFFLYRCRLLHGSPWLAVPLIMILLSIPHLWLVWHGDAMEVRRHSLTAIIQAWLGFTLLYVYLLDILSAHVPRWKRLASVAAEVDSR